jgi:glycosyltransferase involved in cell wall biosynthesis
VTVIPFVAQKTTILQNVPAGIKILPPLLEQVIDRRWSQVGEFIKSPRRLNYLREFIRQRVFKRKKWILEWLAAIVRTERLLDHEVIKNILVNSPGNRDTILYFYWGFGSSQIIPFIKKAGYNKIIVRFHGFDLYEDRKDGYIPFRQDLLKKLDFAVPISEHGNKYLHERYPGIKFKSQVFRLGCFQNGLSQPSSDHKLRIVSCSNVIPLKRLDLIATALKYIDFEVQWTHLGDGEKFDELKNEILLLPKNIHVALPGRISPEDVLDFYSQNSIDLFLNVSTSEGVPVSIMEAFSAGIPVYATDVGGTAEIVNTLNGKLLIKEITPVILADELKLFASLTADYKLNLRKNALETYITKCSFERLNKEFIGFLNS